MIHIEPYALGDDERRELHEWINHPSRKIFQKVLNSQAAEQHALAAKALHEDDQNSKADSEEAIFKAKMLENASRFFDQMTEKDSKNVYLVRLLPEPPTK